MNKDLFYCPALNTKWNLYPNKYIFYAHSKKVGKSFIDYQLLSLTKAGVITKDINSNEGKLPESFENYQTVECNDMILCLFDLDVSAVFSGISNYNGMITSAYNVFGINRNLAIPKFIDYWFSNIFSNRSYCVFSKSLRHTITWDIFKKLPTALPPLPIQNKIVEILDDKIAKIDALIEIENKQIEKLVEYKKAVITKAVTKGLDSNAKMKDSGVEWIGEIPEKWKLLKVKFLSTSIDKGNGITKDQVFDDGDIQCIRYGEIYTRYNNSFEKTFSRTKIADIKSPVYLNYGDILCAGTGELVEEIGKNVVYMGTEPCVVGGDIIIVRHKINPIFFNYALNCQASQFQKSYGKAKLKVVHASAFDIANVMIALPSMNEQQQIADYLDNKGKNINRIIEIKKSKIEKLQAYKKSLIYEYVTGKKEVAL